MSKQTIRAILIVIIVFALSTLACGTEATPEKIGEITSATSTTEKEGVQPTATPQAKGEVSAPTSTPEPQADTPRPTDTPASEGPTIYQVGDIVSIGDVVMVVLGWESPKSTDFAKPDEGNMFVAVDVLLANQGQSARAISSMLQMSLKDGTDQRYTVDFTAAMAIERDSPDGELSAGERLRGTVGFQVPQDAQGLVFVFDAAVFGLGKAFVALPPEPVSLDPPAELAGESEQVTYQVGDVVNIGDSVMVVLGWESPKGTDFSKPDAGNKFVVVDVLLVNKGETSAGISSMMQMSLKDETGQKYTVDLSASMAADRDGPDGELVPGERVRGAVGFQVPEAVQELTFVFDADVFGLGKVLIALPPEQVSLEPPAEVVGETALTVFSVGDVIEMGNLALTVNEVTWPSGDQFNKPKEGKVFLVVDVTIENKSDGAVNVSSMLQMTLKDRTGQKYQLDLMATTASGGTSPDGELSAGERIRGQAGYQVLQDGGPFLFVFDADVFGAGKIFVQLP